jgi:hypothetical protein
MFCYFQSTIGTNDNETLLAGSAGQMSSGSESWPGRRQKHREHQSLDVAF